MRFLLAWELGGGFGHVAPLRAIAKELRHRGHSCVFAVRHLESASFYLGGEAGPILQAPVSIRANDPPPFEHVSYASILLGCGFHRGSALTARLRAWRDLLQLTGCDAVIAHHSPTALLAAHSLSLPAATIGSGFMAPPTLSPMPAFHPNQATQADAAVATDTAVLRVVNEALDRFGRPPLQRLCDLLAGCHYGLFTYPEMDHYTVGHSQPYLGLPEFSHGATVAWGDRREIRLFAYLRPFPGLRELLQALHRLPVQVLIRVAETDLSSLGGLQREGLVIVDRDIDLRAVAADCDVFVNYAAHGTVIEMLLAGKPGLLVPTTLERSLVAGRVSTIGAAIIAPASAGTRYELALEQLLDGRSLRSSAEAFASRHSGQQRQHILPEWCDSFLGRIGTAVDPALQ